MQAVFRMLCGCCRTDASGDLDDIGTHHPRIVVAGPPPAEVKVETVHNSTLSPSESIPNVDYDRLNSAVDDVASDLVENYLDSKLYRSTTVCSSLDRTVLEVSTRHSIALIANALLPYAVPRMEEAFRCPLPPQNQNRNEKTERE